MSLNRRKFLFQISTAVTSLAVANVAVYAVGSAFKKLDGSLVAGAKNCAIWNGVRSTPSNCSAHCGSKPGCHMNICEPNGPMSPPSSCQCECEDN